ncbi:MAG TPA: excinuclease ABC subunit UvrC [Candidatus Onthovicinus excrementipullorum]|nr:excinuclease ABC subunit UvrC [Candidatus Onthovicinus excrementipullorum]
MAVESKNPKIKQLRRKAMSLPLTPGVYIMKDKSGEIIYIGKAKALKNRVSQYFGSQSGHTIKVRRMVDHVQDFDYILTDSEFEALVLECSLIKQHTPKYNILLKDDKGYHYIKVTRGDWPRISAVKQKLGDGAEYIGPYTSSYAVTCAVDEALKIFKLPQCSRMFPRDIGKGRPCLNYFIGQCAAPCARKISREEYGRSVEEALSFLRGGDTSARQMQQEMEEAAENLDFERAAKLRDRIRALEKIAEKQKVVATGITEQDVFAIAQGERENCLVVMRFSDSRLYDSEHFFYEPEGTLEQQRRDLITRYYSLQREIPRRVTLDGPAENPELLERFLREKAGKKVELFIPQRGEQVRLIEMCRSNAAQKLALRHGANGRQMAALDELARLLGLEKPPVWIESYDISHTAGSDNVAGMVVFKDGVPYKKSYRRFKIKGFTGQDDYASMNEVLTRRFEEYFRHQGEEGFGTLPDLILLDGGEGQMHAVEPVLKKFGLTIPLFGMVKDDRHRTRAIATDGGEIAINDKRLAFTLVSTIQEEVHRFAITYHRQSHARSALTSSLTQIEGIGPNRARSLLARFRTVKKISEASVEELAAAEGMGRSAAQAVYNFYHPSTND